MKREEKLNLITIYKLMNNLKKTDRKDQILRIKGKAGYLRKQKKKIAKRNLLEHKKNYCFLWRSIDTWNGLKKGL